MTRTRSRIATVALLATACSAQTPSDTRATGQRLWMDTAHGELIATDGDRGSVTVTTPELGDVREVVVGVDPARILTVGDEMFVSLRGQREVVVLARQGATWAVTRRIAVGAEPVGLALDGPARRLWVAASQADVVEVIPLGDGEARRTVPIPGHPHALAIHPSGAVFVSTEVGGRVYRIDAAGVVTPVELPAPLGGLPGQVLTPRITGDLAVSPDGAQLVVPMAFLSDTVAFPELPDGTAVRYYAGTDPFTPALVDVELDGDGVPQGTPTVTPLFEDTGASDLPTAVVMEGDTLYVALESRGDVLQLPAAPGARIFGDTFRRTLHAGAGLADGIAIDPAGRPVVSSRLLRAVTRVDGSARVEQPPSPLSELALRGRRLFFASNEPTMSADGLACGSCHAEGRADGITWSFARGRRQTPSLTERVTERTPLRWGGDRETVAEDAVLTARLMGGTGLARADGEAVEAFVSALRPVDLPLRGTSDADIARGRAVFEASGCASCHAGELLTDLDKHALTARTEVLTPSLLGVAATAPYLFDGSASSLEAVLDAAPGQAHGDMTSVGADDRAALLRYVRSL